MTHEEKSICPVCGKKKSRMAAHFAISHPELNPDDYGILTKIAAQSSGPVAAGAGDLLPPPGDPPELPNDPPAERGVSQAINTLLSHIEEQAATIKALNERTETITRELSAFQQNVGETFKTIPQVVNHSVTAHFDQLVAAAQARQAVASGDGEGQTNVEIQPPPPQPSNRPDLLAVMMQLAPFLQKVFAPEGSGGTDFDKIVKTFEGIDRLAELRQAPYRHGQEDTLRLLTTADKMGIPLQRVAEAYDQERHPKTQPGPAPASGTT